jgi:hypothetical protein
MSGYVVTVTVIEDGIDVEAVEYPGATVDYDTLSNAVGGYIERVSLRIPEFPQDEAPKPFAFDVWVNEEGLLQALPFNPVVTLLAKASGWQGDGLVGNAIITGNDGSPDTPPLSEEQAIVVMAFFSTVSKMLWASLN